MTEYCTQCPNNCSADDLQCGRGRRYFAALNGEEWTENEEFDMTEEGRHNGRDQDAHGRGRHGDHGMHDYGPHGRGNEGNDRHGHGPYGPGSHDHGSHGSGPHDHGPHGRGGHAPGPHRMTKEEIEQTSDPGILLRACGHELHHGRRNAPDSQQRILQILAKAQEEGYDVVSQRRLQEMLHIQPGSMSEILTKLENKGFIRRERDEEDRRRVGLRLIRMPEETAAAGGEPGEENNIEEDMARLRHGTEAAFDILSEEEKLSLVSILKKLLISWL